MLNKYALSFLLKTGSSASTSDTETWWHWWRCHSDLKEADKKKGLKLLCCYFYLLIYSISNRIRKNFTLKWNSLNSILIWVSRTYRVTFKSLINSLKKSDLKTELNYECWTWMHGFRPEVCVVVNLKSRT